MSKATFPNTTRRRLSSSVVCRLSSSGAAFFFARLFFHDPSLHSDKRPPKQGPYSCCSRPMIGLRGLWLGALRGPWPVQPMKTRGLWPMTTLRGLWPGAVTPRGLWPMIALRSLWLGGAARPVAIAADDDASWPVACGFPAKVCRLSLSGLWSKTAAPRAPAHMRYSY